MAISVEDYYLNNDLKIVRLKMEGKKLKPQSHFDNKMPSYRKEVKSKATTQWVYDDKAYHLHNLMRDDINDYTMLAADTTDVYQLDFDEVVDKEVIDKLKNEYKLPYFNSCTKGYPHFVFRDKKLSKTNEYKNFITANTSKPQGQLLCGLWSFASKGASMFNIDDGYSIVDFDLMGSGLIRFEDTETQPNAKKRKFTIVPSLKPKKVSNEMYLKLKEFAECIDIEKHIATKTKSYTHWRNIVYSLYGYKELAREISMKGGKLYDEAAFEKLYASNKGGITKNTFFHYCKLGNPVLFNQLQKKYYKRVDITNAIVDCDKADLLFNECGDNWIYLDKGNNAVEVYFWDDNVCRWLREDRKELTHTKQFIKNKLKEWGEENLQKAMEDDTGTDMMKLQTLVKITNRKIGEIKRVAEALMLNLAGRHDNVEFDNKPYLFAFKNKVYDFQAREFTIPLKDHYLTTDCGYDWEEPSEEENNVVKGIFEKTIKDEDVRRGYVSVLRNGFIGICPQKFIIANGSGRNGKGQINNWTMRCLGEYGYKGNIDTLCSPLKAGNNPEVANMHKKRFVVFSEGEAKAMLNSATIKELSGGGQVNARLNYSNDTKTSLSCVLVFECNPPKPTMSGADADSIALIERVNDYPFEAKFIAKTEEEVDEANNIYRQDDYYTSEEFYTLHRCALFNYIKNYEGVETIYIPEIVKQRSKKYLLDSDIIYKFVSEQVEIRDDYDEKKNYVKVSDLYESFKVSEVYLNMSKNERRNHSLKSFRSTIETHSQFKKYFTPLLKTNKNKSCVRNVLVKAVRQSDGCLLKDVDDDSESECEETDM